jgi:hypothetical protein
MAIGIYMHNTSLHSLEPKNNVGFLWNNFVGMWG